MSVENCRVAVELSSCTTSLATGYPRARRYSLDISLSYAIVCENTMMSYLVNVTSPPSLFSFVLGACASRSHTCDRDPPTGEDRETPEACGPGPEGPGWPRAEGPWRESLEP